VRDTVAEMTAKAQEISLEAGSKMAAAMKDVIGAAAGLTGFVAESARDLVQYMVRRGQMTQEEADKLIRDVEEHHGKRKAAGTARPSAPAKAASKPAAKHSATAHKARPAAKSAAKPAAKKAAAKKPAAKKPAAKSARKPARKAGRR
jgi:polyhydroxyalkanoate synthesis regulator phasin